MRCCHRPGCRYPCRRCCHPHGGAAIALAVVILSGCCHPHGDAAIVLAVVILARNIVRGMSCAKRDFVRGMPCAKSHIVREMRHRARNETPCAKSHILRETRYRARNEVSCAKKHTSKPFIFQKFCLILRPVLDTSPMWLRRSFAIGFLQRP